MPDTTPAPAAPAAAPPPAAAAPVAAAPTAAAAPPPSALGSAAVAPKVDEAAKAPVDAKPAEKPVDGAKPAIAELKVPKGFEAISEALSTSAKELGLEGEKAQKYADTVATLDAARSKALDTAAEQQEARWLEEARADPDIGGAKWEASMQGVNKALSKFGGPLVQVGDRQIPQLAVLLERAGLGNNKHVLKAFALVGNALKDDSIAGTEKPAPKTAGRVTDAEALYGPK